MRSPSPVVGWERPSSARQRLRTLKALIQVIALALATFLLLPMVVAAAPGDALTVQPGGKVSCEFTGDAAFPGESLYCILRVGSIQTSVDQDVFLFIDPGSVKVLDNQDRPVSDTDAREFRAVWEMSVWGQNIVTRSAPADRDVGYLDRQERMCPLARIENYDGVPIEGNPFIRTCPLGVVRGIAGPRASMDSGDPAYQRLYQVEMKRKELSRTEPDRSFHGWALVFDIKIVARVPADDPCPAPRAGGVCTSPLYIRR